VGSHFNGSADQALIEHWNGTSWKSSQARSSVRSTNDVAATSSSNAWAVGVRWTAGDVARTLIEHWNGSSWTIVASPNIGTVQDQLVAVAATSSTNAWAVGFRDTNGAVARTLIAHWNGISWVVQPSPNVGSNDNFLQDVSANSPQSAWTVGYYMNGAVARTLAFHCC
jgi:myosin-crossreactive antigen